MPDQFRFCRTCGVSLIAGAKFCHVCGTPVGGIAANVRGPARWLAPLAVIAAVAVFGFFTLRARGVVTVDPEQPLLQGRAGVPDISAMSPRERADRLFNRVMQYWSNGRNDSAAFFAPMAIAALSDLRPLDAHIRYDIGMVALAGAQPDVAAAQSDTILAGRATHLLGLSLAARAADARGDAPAARSFRQRLAAAGEGELAQALPEYRDHDADIRDALAAARR